VAQDRIQRFRDREVRCDTGAVPATVTGKQHSENHSQLVPWHEPGKAECSVDGTTRCMA
jgi:hypothetical protein